MEPNAANLFSIESQIAIVTGANRGIGRAIAEGFLAAGAVVCFVGRTESIVKQVAAYGSDNAHSFVCDLSDGRAISQLVAQINTKLKRIDILVNNAGISISENPYSEETWQTTINLNLTAVFHLASAVAEVMKTGRSGSIINLTSIGSELGFPNNPSYLAAKGGVRQLTKAMARDYAQYGIRVNNLCPGYIRTNMTEKSFNDPELRKERSQRTLLGRFGETSELVGPAIYLASQASSYVSGTDLCVDGGWLAKGL